MRKQVLSFYSSQLSRNGFRAKPIEDIEAVKEYINETIADEKLKRFLINQLNDAQNKLLFTAIMRQLFPHNLIMYDIDAIPVLIMDNGRRKRYLGFFELKFKHAYTTKGLKLTVNWAQFETLYYLSRLLNRDLYYFVNVEWEEFYLFNASRVVPKSEIRGKGIARDRYAVIEKDFVVKMKPEEVIDTFKLLFKGVV